MSRSELIQPSAEVAHPIGVGTQRIYRFDNGYGASVVRFTIAPGVGSYGAGEDLWELAVVRFTGPGVSPKDFELTYGTPLTDDVIGWLSDEDVQEKLRQIRDLPPVTAAVTA